MSNQMKIVLLDFINPPVVNVLLVNLANIKTYQVNIFVKIVLMVNIKICIRPSPVKHVLPTLLMVNVLTNVYCVPLVNLTVGFLTTAQNALLVFFQMT
tara:strand:- start:264 stop:557 length:294 start_codon:yes stop_codon:yes gene_type:complete